MAKKSKKPKDEVEYVDMGFHVTKKYRGEYKLAALRAGKTMKKVLEEGFELFLKKNGLK